MACIKCGKKTKGDQVFCKDCLASMEAYPVKSDVPIQLPNRSAADAQKKAGKKRRNPTIEEQVVSLRRTVCWLLALIALLVSLLCVAGYMLFLLNDQPESSSVGKDYTYVGDLG